MVKPQDLGECEKLWIIQHVLLIFVSSGDMLSVDNDLLWFGYQTFVLISYLVIVTQSFGTQF